MEIKQVPVNQLKMAPWNPRVHPDKAIDKLIKSFEAFGFTNPILAQRKTKMVIAGHARLKAAKKAKAKRVPVIYLDPDDAKAKAYGLADNRLQEETSWDFAPLADLLLDLDQLNVDLDFTGFDADEVVKLMNWTPNGDEVREDDFNEKLPKKPITRMGDAT